MPASAHPSNRSPAEGGRETAEHELRKTADQKGATPLYGRQKMAPGDEAAPGTPGTGEDTCPACQGSGRRDARPCPNCLGTGLIVRAIGGA